MRPLLVFSLHLAILGFCFGSPQQPVPSPEYVPKYLEQIPLQFAVAKEVVNSFAGTFPPGVKSVSIDPDAKNGIRVLGTADGIAQVKTMVHLLDIPPRQAKVSVVLEKIRFGSNGQLYKSTVSRKTFTLTSNVPVAFQAVDLGQGVLAASIMARFSPAASGPANVFAKLGWKASSGMAVGLEGIAPFPTENKYARILGITSFDDSPMISKIGAGGIPTKWVGKAVAYYILVKPLDTEATQ